MAFTPEYGASLMSRLFKGEDGNAPDARAKGKKPSVLGVEFGEKLLFESAVGRKFEELSAKWEHGGICWGSEEYS